MMRARVTALTGTGGPGVYVVVLDLNDRHTWGPCTLTETVRRLGTASGASSAANTGAQTAGTAHTHPIPHTHTLAGALAVGDKVLVDYLGAGTAELIIIDRL